MSLRPFTRVPFVEPRILDPVLVALAEHPGVDLGNEVVRFERHGAPGGTTDRELIDERIGLLVRPVDASLPRAVGECAGSSRLPASPQRFQPV